MRQVIRTYVCTRVLLSASHHHYVRVVFFQAIPAVADVSGVDCTVSVPDAADVDVSDADGGSQYARLHSTSLISDGICLCVAA